VLRRGAVTGPPRPEDQTLCSLVDWRAEATPDRILLVDEPGRTMTAGEFRASSQRVAERLAAAGVGRGSVVSWILPTGMDALVLSVALSRLGAVQIPVIPVYREREIGHILGETSLDAFIVTPQWRGFDYLALCRHLASERGGRTVVHTIDTVVCDTAAPLGDNAGPSADRDLGATQWIFYTSGTGGLPKGVRHADAGLAAAARGMVNHLAMTSEDRSGVAFPIAHIGGPINLMAGLLAGSTLILIENFDPRRTSDVLAREGVTMAGSGTAFHLAYLDVQAQRPEEPLFPHLRFCPGGGAPKPAGLHERVQRELGGAGIVSGWGLTEAPVLTMGRPGDRDDQLSETEGSPLPGVQLRTVSSGGRTCGAGEQGELRALAPQLMLGYVDPSLTADAFDDEGWLRTGDLGTIDDEGYVRITGRLKDVVIRNGENIGTAEVEELLRGHPQVADAAVFGLPDSRTGERVCAVVELVPTSPRLDLDDVCVFLESRGLRRQAWPEQLETMEPLPRTVAGKIDTRQLREQFGAARSSSP
jgi:acyl-CoA synthetase (AMP-forming)/AMP-acid ligase II